MSIKIANLTYVYSPNTAFEKKALDNINIEIDKGSFIGIIGHTGSGKSTLIQHLNGLLQPTYGEVLLNDININSDKSKLKEVRQKIGLVFQYPEHQLFETTVYKDVSYGPINMGLPEQEVNRRVEEALELVGLTQDIYDKSPFELSGGQKRRVAIAGVLAMEPEVLVMDEPTAGLDPHGRDNILDQIRTMHTKRKNTVILVSHSMEDISRLVDKIIVLHEGKVKYCGVPKDVFSHAEELEKIGLAAPQISYLIKALEKKGIYLNKDVFTVEEATKEIYKYLTK